jgi:hypothetical protein
VRGTQSAAFLLAGAVGVLSVLPAAWDVLRVAGITLAQLAGGPAAGTDFLNLYSGARLFVTDPSHVYDLQAQTVIQRSLTHAEGALVPFYLPPHAALAVAWLGWLPYGVAYTVWLVLNVACLVLATYWLAPGSGRWRTLRWCGASLLFLPIVLTLGQGQTSLIFLAAFAMLVGTGRGLTVWTAKGQLALGVFGAALLARRWRSVLTTVVLVALLTVAAVARIGPNALADYRGLTAYKLLEPFVADPVFLLGPTVLHASRWFLDAPGLGLVASCWLLALLVYVWREGPAPDDARLLQWALVPLVTVLAAPYALVYETTVWLASFWLLWRYSESRPNVRAAVLWLTLPTWIAANVGVALPREGGADFAALAGLGLTALTGWLFLRHPRPTTSSARSPLPVVRLPETLPRLQPARPGPPR